MLDWLGDVGGLFDGLKIVGAILLGPFSSLNLGSTILRKFFKENS